MDRHVVFACLCLCFCLMMDTQGTSSKRVGWTDMLVGAAALLENTERWDWFACFSVILCICIWHLAGLHNWRLVLIRKFYPRNAYFVFFCDIRSKNAVNQGFWCKTGVFILAFLPMHYLLILCFSVLTLWNQKNLQKLKKKKSSLAANQQPQLLQPWQMVYSILGGTRSGIFILQYLVHSIFGVIFCVLGVPCLQN